LFLLSYVSFCPLYCLSFLDLRLGIFNLFISAQCRKRIKTEEKWYLCKIDKNKDNENYIINQYWTCVLLYRCAYVYVMVYPMVLSTYYFTHHFRREHLLKRTFQIWNIVISILITVFSQGHFSFKMFKGPLTECPTISSKGLKRRDSWKASLPANSSLWTPSSQSLWLYKQNVFIFF
jgi:hypothetical protein